MYAEKGTLPVLERADQVSEKICHGLILREELACEFIRTWPEEMPSLAHNVVDYVGENTIEARCLYTIG